MSLINTAKEWLFSIALKKGIQTGLKALLGTYGLSTAEKLTGWGITVTFQEATLISSVVGGLEILRNYLKQKYDLKFL